MEGTCSTVFFFKLRLSELNIATEWKKLLEKQKTYFTLLVEREIIFLNLW